MNGKALLEAWLPAAPITAADRSPDGTLGPKKSSHPNNLMRPADGRSGARKEQSLPADLASASAAR